MRPLPINPLICAPSPRDIPEVAAELGKVKADKLYAKYFPEFDAYYKLRDWFLNKREYSHMVICPDDLIVTSEAFEILREDQMQRDYPVLAGICNLAYNDLNTLSLCKEPGTFRFLTQAEIQEEIEKQKSPIIEIKHEAFACCWIRRDVVEQIEFRGMPVTSFDWGFSQDCNRRGIPIYVDTRARMMHLANRKGDGTHEYMFLNKKTAHMHYKRWDGEGKIWWEKGIDEMDSYLKSNEKEQRD